MGEGPWENRPEPAVKGDSEVRSFVFAAHVESCRRRAPDRRFPTKPRSGSEGQASC